MFCKAHLTTVENEFEGSKMEVGNYLENWNN